MRQPFSLRTLALVLAEVLLAGLVSCASSPRQQDPVPKESWGAGPALPKSLAEKVLQEPVRFRPPVPQSDSFDWIKLSSGEWLKGEIMAMRKDSLEFDSDELDMLNLDWGDILEVHCPREVMVSLSGRRIVTGPSLLVRDGVVVLAAREGAQEVKLDREDVIGLIPGTQSESDYWSGKLSFGLVTKSGNTSSTDGSTYMFARRESADTRWDTSYDGSYSKTSGTVTASNNRVKSQYDVFLSDKLYVTPLGVTWVRDRFQNIYGRTTPYTGLGYDVFEKWQMEWDVTAAVGFQRTEFFSAPANQDDVEDSMSLIFGSRFSWDLTPDIEFDFDYDLSMPVPDTDEFNHHAAFRLAVDVTGSFDIDISLIWDRVNKPAESASGVSPEKDDFRMTIGLGYEF